ncbi:aldo/keto reductase [Actinocorallia sp. A-T 12471]|uniref:aldo/keto reductase n=1 Tax=Actinocorallia sp. A-T 12471 TaxID=3089813 RepID=UPI0029CE11D8|nr:aldo/keto reductase [Actinocorallia sp. A-T 12471]MDX6742478.1 aldo/keto reductase [Actinocorallia sp. A-T 12471]
MKTIELNNGVVMPRLGFGVWQVGDDEAVTAVGLALEAGYRSIDTASAYGNERGVGRAVRESGLPREEIFVTTKLWNADHGYDQALKAFDTSLDKLGAEYVDLYLIHWPMPARDDYVETWRALERIAGEGRARAVGVSNFAVPHLKRLAAETGVVPAVNQIELHPYLTQTELRAYHAEHGIATEAWSPLGQGRGLLNDPALARIAAAHDRSPAQIVLRWHLQSGNIAIPKSVTPSRITENHNISDFTLTPQEMTAIDSLNSNTRYGPDPLTFSN